MLGDAIRRARLRAGLTQEDLGFRAKVSRVYVSQLERNEKSPTVEVLFRLAQAMGTKASSLLAAVERRRSKLR